jgi:hypothetical protein
MGAPLSIACDACAWRSQWIDAAGLTPARSAASLTMKLTARSVSGLPGRRTDWNTGADAGASPRLANRRAAIGALAGTGGRAADCGARCIGVGRRNSRSSARAARRDKSSFPPTKSGRDRLMFDLAYFATAWRSIRRAASSSSAEARERSDEMKSATWRPSRSRRARHRSLPPPQHIRPRFSRLTRRPKMGAETMDLKKINGRQPLVSCATVRTACTPCLAGGYGATRLLSRQDAAGAAAPIASTDHRLADRKRIERRQEIGGERGLLAEPRLRKFLQHPERRSSRRAPAASGYTLLRRGDL